MSQAILNQILDQLKILDLSELQQLSQAIEGYLTNRERAAKKVAFHQALIASGLVCQIKKTADRSMHRQLIQVQGKPMSLTILEERR